MNVSVSAFNFTDEYRTLQPVASREVVAARETSHVELAKAIKYANQVLDLCRLAYQMPVSAQSNIREWFEAEIKKTDPQFSLMHDRAEAGRIAAILLRQRLKQGHTQDAVAVLATSFCGQRVSADDDALPRLARDCLVRAARSLRTSATLPEVTYSKKQDRSALITAMEQAFASPAVKAVTDALAADAQTAGESLAQTAAAAVKALFDENQRLAEEIDLLWWHNGDWCECLDRPLADVPPLGRALIVGADLAAMIRLAPGPYGTNGILRRSLGKDADRSVSLREAVEAIEPEDLKQAFPAHADQDILPVHIAAKLYFERDRGAWGQTFEQVTGVTYEGPLTHYKLALQAFWECSLVKHGWAK
jgi:GTPase-associated system helical domain